MLRNELLGIRQGTVKTLLVVAHGVAEAIKLAGRTVTPKELPYPEGRRSAS